MSDPAEMSWAALNTALAACEDEAVLTRWLRLSIEDGRLTRAVRVYGRLSAVRRKREVEELRTKCANGKKRAAA